MKKLIFVAVCFICSMSACTNLGGVSPDTSSSNSSASSSSSSSSGHISLNSVPQSAKDFVSRNYAGWVLTAAEKELEHGQIQYKLKIEKGGNTLRLIFDANWKFLQVKN